MGDSQDQQLQSSHVESVDFSEQSIDDQLVQLAQAKLDGRIDQETYERLVSLLKELPPRDNWDSSKAIEYATPQPKEPIYYSILKRIVATICVLLSVLILWGILSPNPTARFAYALPTAAKNDISNLETALDAFATDNGRFPTSAEGLGALLKSPANLASSWRGPYVKSIPADPWSRAYVYRSPGIHHPNGYDLSSVGVDGVAETMDDIVNWDVRAR